ncbi:MAG: pro-sigmaK processing inhibitor BofA family protein [Clostridia bacterium]
MQIEILYYIGGGFALLVLLSLFLKPARIALSGVLKTGIGFAVACGLNATGLAVGLNLLTSAIIGLLGLPGLAAVLLMNWIY